MKIEIRLRIDAGDDGPCDEEVLVLDKPHDQLKQVGLSLAEAKELLGRVQERVGGAQATAFLADNRCPLDPARLPLPGGPVVVGIDGAYVRAREPGRAHHGANFEVVVGQSIAQDRDSRYFGLVQRHR